MIPNKAVEAIHAAICEESLEDHMDPAWPGRCVKAAQATYPHLMAAAWDEGYENGLKFGPPRNPYNPRPPKWAAHAD